MTKDELQKAVDDVIADCIRNDYAFGSYAYKVAEAIWPLLEAAEKSDAESIAMYRRARDERDALRAKITEMEKQAPIGTAHAMPGAGAFTMACFAAQDIPVGAKLYALPGAQPAPSVPNGWLRAIDEALVTAHIGVANAEDTYEQAKAKLDSLIGWHTDVATDPAVNGGYRLIPIEPTEDMLRAMTDPFIAINGDNRKAFEIAYTAMLAAAPEEKP